MLHEGEPTQGSFPIARPSIAMVGSRGYPSYYGGFETLVRQLAPFLADRGWDVTVYGRPDAIRHDDPERDPRVRSLHTAGLDTKSLSTLSFGLTSTVDAARRRPDVAFVMNVANGFFLPLLKRRGIPTVVNVDGIEWEREKWGRAARTAFLTGARMTAKHATSIVVDSVVIGDRWSNEFGRTGPTIAYGGDRPRELPVPEGLEAGKYALIVARFVPENSVEEFFQAAEDLSNDWDVVLVGSTGYGGELDERARHLDETHPRIKWDGHIHDDDLLFALWQHAGVYFHGHSVGGTNPALVQAMACGAPTVARDTLFNREVLGSEGRFVEPEPAAINAQLREVLEDAELQEQLRASALRRQAESYTWERVCSAYEQAFQEAIQAQAR